MAKLEEMADKSLSGQCLPNGADVSWAGVGRLLAKCVMDGVSVAEQWHPLFFEHVLTGRSVTTLESALDALDTWALDLHRDATRVLQSRLCSLTRRRRRTSGSSRRKATSWWS